MAIDINHPIYDCIYLAAAEAQDAVVVSDDRRLLLRIKGHALEPLVRPLREARP